MKTCQEITEDIEKANFKRLTVTERLEIRLHISMCRNCRQYSKDSKILDRMLQKRFNSSQKFAFSKEEKEVLKNKFG